MRSRYGALVRTALLAGAVGALIPAAPGAAADYKLTILHVNDLQSRLAPVTETGHPCTAEDVQARRCAGGVARLAARIKAEKASAANAVVVDAGNAFTGSQFYDTHKQRALSETMNLIGFDAMTVGDREFVDGTEMLSRFQQAVRFPLLGANIDVQRDPHMKDRIYPILVTDRGHDRIALIGYSTEHLIELAKPTGVVYIQRIEAALKFWIKQIQMMGVNKIIAVSHAGLERDRQIAATVEGIDVIVGSAAGVPRSALQGATQMASKGPPAKGAAPHYPMVLKGVGGQSVLLVHAGEFGRSLGRLDVTFDAKGVPKHWTGGTIELTDADAEDPGLRDLVAALGTPTAALPAPAPTAVR
jgi:5'-nucleotidase/UDP-sugar diphosphatase